MTVSVLRREVPVEQEGGGNNEGFRIAILSTRAHADDVLEPMVTATITALVEMGIARRNVVCMRVNRAIDLPFAAMAMTKTKARTANPVDGIICLGVLIQDEQPREQLECQSRAIAQGLMKCNLKGTVPVVYGMLTCATVASAKQEMAAGEDLSHTLGWQRARALLEMIRIEMEVECA